MALVKRALERRQWLAAAFAPPRFALDGDGMARMDGERAFILGLYAAPRSGGLRAARDAGFSLVHASATRAALDAVAAAGLRAWVTVGSDLAKLETTVTALRDHPALFMWETEDEPSYQWKKPGPRVRPEVIRAAHARLARLDPSRPAYLNHAPTNLVSTLRAYDPGASIIATDIYPVIPPGIREQYALWPDGRQGDLRNTTLSQVGDYVDKMRAVAGPSRGLWMVLQGFAWEMARPEKDRDPRMVLYPGRAQLEFMAWQSIVHGVTGLLWWGLQLTPPEAPLWPDLAAVTRQLHALRRDLAAPRATLPVTLEYHDTGHSLDRGLEWIAKEGGLFAAVNADPNPLAFTLRGLPGRPAPILGPGPAPRIDLPPFGVLVWRLRA